MNSMHCTTASKSA